MMIFKVNQNRVYIVSATFRNFLFASFNMNDMTVFIRFLEVFYKF